MSLIDRIDAVSRFLNSLAGNPAFEIARPAQAQALLSEIDRLSTLSLHDGAVASEKITECLLWSAAEKNNMLTAIVSKSCCAAAASLTDAGRRVMQDYTAVHGYFTNSLWNIITGQDVTPSKKLEMLLTHAANLGLRNPSESTMQLFSAVYLTVSEGAAFEQWSPAARLQTYKALKAEFKRLVSKMPATNVHLQTLPSDPAEFKNTQRGLYDLAFPSTEGPVGSRILTVTLQRAMSIIPMRSTRVDSSHARATSSSQAPSFDIGLGHAMQQFAAGMQAQLQSMQSAQQQMLQAISSGAVQPTATSAGVLRLTIPVAEPRALTLGVHQERFLRRAQSPLALQDIRDGDAGDACPLPSVPEPGLSSCPQPVHEPASCPEPMAPDAVEAVTQAPSKPKSVAQAAAAMIAAIDSKAQKRKLEQSAAVAAKIDKNNKETTPAKTKTSATTTPVKNSAQTQLSKNPQVGHEASRNQFMCRTGLPGKGQCTAIAYDPKAKGAMEAARVKADRWLKAEKKKRGVE
jgi:hypothetical protein